MNWTLLDSPELHQPTSARVAPSGDLGEWYFRVERQTLRQLPRTKAIVFTIRTYVASAESLRDRDDTFVSSLLNALESAPTAMKKYKGWTGVAERVRNAL